MIYRSRICFITNFLGGGPRDKNSSVRRIKRTYESLVEINPSSLSENLQLANQQLKADININNFIIPEGFHDEDQVSVIKRIFNRVNIDFFEGLEKGSKVYLDLMFKKEPKDCPSLDTISSLLDIVGRYHGISQWGAKFHCGRFKVLNTERITLKNYDNKNLLV